MKSSRALVLALLLIGLAPFAHAQVEQGGPCTTNDDCAGNLYCNASNVCAVDTSLQGENGYSGYGSQNGSVAPGGACEYDADCADQGSTQYSCINATCKPDNGLEGVGGICSSNNDCQGQLYCSPNHTCQVDASLGSPCTTDAQCPGSSCSISTFTCTGTVNPPGTGNNIGGTGTSGVACTSSLNCPAGQTCSFGSCVGGAGTSGTSGLPGSGGLLGGTTGGGGFPSPNATGIQNYANAIISFINGYLVPLLIAVAFIVFLWGVANAYILHPDSEDKRKEGHQFILWAVVGFVVIFALWGIVNLVGSTIGLGGTRAGNGLNYPTL